MSGDLETVKALLPLLREHGVREFEGLGLVLRMGPPPLKVVTVEAAPPRTAEQAIADGLDQLERDALGPLGVGVLP